MVQPQYWLRYFPRTRSGKPHHANAATAQRGCDGDDSVVEIHAPIVAGTLEEDQAARNELRETQLRTGLCRTGLCRKGSERVSRRRTTASQPAICEELRSGRLGGP